MTLNQESLHITFKVLENDQKYISLKRFASVDLYDIGNKQGTVTVIKKNVSFDCVNAERSNYTQMSCVMRKPEFCLCENKGADQLRSNCFSFSYIQNFKLLACICECTGRFVSDLVRNPENWFSHVMAQMSISFLSLCCIL